MTPALTVAWMTQAIVISVLLAGTAWLVQRVACHVIPSRLIWGSAIFCTLVLVVAAPWRTSAAPLRLPETAVQASPQANTVQDDGGSWVGSRAVRTLIERTLTAPAAFTVSTLGAALNRAPQSVQRLILLAWPLSSAAVFLAFALSYRRHRRLLRGATTQPINGIDVLVTKSLGPAVIGVRAPRIVVPEWLFDHPPQEQSLVVAHEQSHITARDPALLLSACAAVVVMPWNPVAWYALEQLRLAIEFDCDHRVLGRGISLRQYGQLLITLSARMPRNALSPSNSTALAFSHHQSHLERRLRTMTTRPSSFRRSRVIASAIVSAVALLAACESQLPTTAELQDMTVKTAEARLAKVTPIDTTTAIYLVDGVAVTRDSAIALDASRIATIDVRGGKSQELRIATVKGKPADKVIIVSGEALSPSASQTPQLRIVTGQGATPNGAVMGRPLSPSDTRAFEGLLMVDGVRAPSTFMNSLRPDEIASIEVVKGEAAVTRFGADAAKGAILVTTKKKK